MKMKKLLTSVLAVAMVASLAACGSSASTETTVQATESAAESTAAETAAAETDEAASTEAESTDAAAFDLAGKKIGVQLGTTGDQLATEYEQNDGSTVERFNKGADAIQALKQGKIDCVVIDYNPAKAFVEKNDDLQILDEELSSEEYAMCVNKDNSELTAKINEALTQLKEDGTLDAIVSNYIGDEAGQHPYTSPEGVDRSNGTLVMATNATFEPYEYYEDQKVVGIDPDIAQAVCDVLGYDLKIEDMEFDSIIPAVTSGKASMGMAGMTVTPDRLKSVDFSDTYATGVQAIIVKEGSDITSVDDLFAEGASHKIGVQTGTTGDLYTTDDIEGAGLGTVERFQKGADAVLALTQGKIDCVVIDNNPAKSFVAANEGLKILDTEYAVEDYAICLPKNSPLTEKINTALAELTADGTIQKIIDKYISAE